MTVLKFILGAFFLLHGMVHLLYAGQTLGLFELQPGLAWPEGAWVLWRLLGERATRIVAGVACGLTAAGFAVGGTALLVGQAWWRPLIGFVVAFSMIVFVLLWNGRLERLADQGWIAVLLDAAILVGLFVLRPSLGF